jgi:hypothetical protein
MIFYLTLFSNLPNFSHILFKDYFFLFQFYWLFLLSSILFRSDLFQNFFIILFNIWTRYQTYLNNPNGLIRTDIRNLIEAHLNELSSFGFLDLFPLFGRKVYLHRFVSVVHISRLAFSFAQRGQVSILLNQVNSHFRTLNLGFFGSILLYFHSYNWFHFLFIEYCLIISYWLIKYFHFLFGVFFRLQKD